MSRDASMSPPLINPNPPSPHLAYPGPDDDDDAATRNESPPVTTPADHPELSTAPKAPLSPLVAAPAHVSIADTPMDGVDALADSVLADSALDTTLADTAMVSSPPPLDTAMTAPDAVLPSAKRELPADESEPVAKRARSEASGSGAASMPVPTPLAAYTTFQDPPPPPYTGPTAMSLNQHKFCFSTVRTLKRLKDATPFLRPVDPVALNIPHYPIVIKRPMDFGTIETKLQNSSPNKPPSDPSAPRYRVTDDFVADVRQIFQNCYLFNGPEHFISHQARKLEDILDKQLKQMPPDEEVKPVPRYESPPQPKKSSVPPPRRQSTSVPTIRRNTPDDYPSPVARPKREIHPPPPKDLPYSDAPTNGKRARKGKNRGPERDDGTAEQLRYCMKILLDFNKKSLYQTAGPFYEPVDVAYVPNYYKIVKRPMDLATMRRKLDSGEYPNAMAFNNDFRLMMKNCQIFNPPGTAVHSAGLEMDRIFREKWKNLPPLRQLTPDDDEEADSSEDEHAGEDTDLAIALMESQIETMKDSLAVLKAKKKNNPKVKQPPAPPPKEKKAPIPPPKKPVKKPSASYAPPYTPAPGPSRAKPAAAKPTPAKTPTSNKKSKNGAGSDTERSISTMSFEQKKELSTTIESLDGDKLEKVIQIIYEGMPDLQNSNEEIELDIESLSPAVLTKLWNFVVKPQQQKKSAVTSSGPKRTSGNASKGAAATGGVKRKSMDEAVESERIRKLQAQIDRFGKQGGDAGGIEGDGYDDDAHSSNGSASDSDSSDSD